MSNGWLYGSTSRNSSTGTIPPSGSGGGTIYRLRPDGTDFTVLKQFLSENGTTDGLTLFDSITINNNEISGVARNGGEHGYGTFFSISTDGDNFNTKHHFGDTSDGRHPYSAPTKVDDSTYYGLAFSGGAHGGGIIYSLDTLTNAYSVHHNFSLPGGAPFGSLTAVGDWLYGMVSDHRDTEHYGAIFRYSRINEAYETIYTFEGQNSGGYPYDTLTWDGKETLYGTTLGYYPFRSDPEPTGLTDEGVIFKINTLDGSYDVIHDFASSTIDGAKPNSEVLIGPDGKLYGISHGAESWGGAGYEYGTLYRLNTDGSGFEVLHTFDSNPHGNTPMRALTWHNGYVYGTTAFGGSSAGVGNGTVWRYKMTPVPEPKLVFQALVAVGTVMYWARKKHRIPRIANHVMHPRRVKKTRARFLR